ncbi:deoxyribose-phosphate aldolase [Roseivirga sp. BDSF3-8]|uniref:deoxyribose-phosphate aldolase n=1 Tax=Roseivirga sp. BDSF3-8 TaxID=3241598 RepID=UPI00353183C7
MRDIQHYLEHTDLRAVITDKDIDRLVRETIEYNFKGLCIPPFWVKKAKRELGKSEAQLATVVGFPLGYHMTETKMEEIRQAINTGVDEVDLVMNISAFKAGLPWVKIELAKCASLCHEHFRQLKVIIETAYLSDDEIVTACKLCSDAGVDFVKTSTGFAGEGAKVEHIKLMREALPSNVGIKASGGIKDLEMARLMVQAGADRIGTSSGIAIVKQAMEEK